MQSDSGERLQYLRVDGGATNNNFLMQFQADILDVNVERPVVKEVTALGAAYLAGLATGFWKDLDELRDKARIERTFSPDSDNEKRERRYKGWKKAVKRSLEWARIIYNSHTKSGQNFFYFDRSFILYLYKIIF